MPKLVLFALGILVLLVFSRRLRGVLFHIRVRRFALIFFTITLITVVGVVFYFLYKFWWPRYMAKPTVEVYDETIDQEINPETPGTGGPKDPVIIQTR